MSMKNMFGFSRRRMKLGRLRVHLGDPLQGTRSPARPTRRLGQSNGENVVLPGSGRSDELDCQCSSGGFELHKSGVGNPESWMVLATEGEEPAPRFHHAASIVGSKMVVVGGESGHGMLNDTMILRMDKLTWYTAASKVSLLPKGLPSKIPACKGHCLVNWGKMVLLIGGKTDPVSDRVSVWSFNIDTEFWSHVEVKGDIPAARSGHTVTKAGPVLILFGGEDAKGRKLNDLHMFDLKSSTWLPLHYRGTGPSPRSNHVAALYDDRILLIFGGQSKSRILNDFYSLDFETMVWSRIKIRGYHPSPRAGCCGALCGTKWFVVGGGSKKKRHAETLVFDVVKYECSASVTSSNASIAINKGFSLVPVHYQDKVFLVAFGGNQKEPSNQVEILMMAENEQSMSWRSAPDTDPLLIENYTTSTKELAAHLHSGTRSHSVDYVARHNLVSTVEQYTSDRKSISDSCIDPNSMPGSISLQKQFHDEEDNNLVPKMQKTLEVDKYKEGDDCSVMEHKSKQQETTIQMDIARILASPEEMPLGADSRNSNLHQKQGNSDITLESDHVIPMETNSKTLLTNPSDIYQLYETKIATLTRKNALLEGQLIAALASSEATEKNLSTAIKSRQDLDRTLADTVKEVEFLKEKLAGVELAHEEANNLSNIVHTDNVRLEHDVAFLKAVLDDTQKELHSTRGVLAGERARAFQLQVEVFHLKQRLQSFESRAPTPRKPFHM